MTTTEQRLADALRRIDAAEREGRAFTLAERDAMRDALAAYDAQHAPTSPPGAWRMTPWGRIEDAEGRAIVNICYRESDAARIVQCVNAHDGLVAALREASRALCELDALGEHHDAVMIDEALTAARVRHA